MNIKKKRLLLFSILLLAGCSLWLLTGNKIDNFLTVNKPLNNANILLVEGWLCDDELKEATKIFTSSESYNNIVATGTKPPQFYEMGMNGDLVFNVGKSNISSGDHKIVVEAYSTMAFGEGGRFSAWINNERVGEATTTKDPKKYIFNIKLFSKIDSITIRFLNDALYEDKDINLYIASVSIDNINYCVNDTNNHYCFKHQPEVQHLLAKTDDIRVKYVLMRYHIPENKILTISTLINSESKTAQTAKNTMHMLDSMFYTDTLKINILSRRLHSRRTYLAFKKFSAKKDQIGIITTHFSPTETEKGRLKKLKELLGILYVKIVPR